MLKIASLDRLIQLLSQLPGVGPKTAQRLAIHILRGEAYSQELRQALLQVEQQVRLCPLCFTYTDAVEKCHFCMDPARSDEVICVVEEPTDIAGIEASGVFKGRYHVLHGVISTLDGVSPHDLKIHEQVREVILALDADLEGDTTVLYLTKRLSDMEIKITRIAHGIPIGSDIDYVDNRTLSRALVNRVELQ